MRQRFILASLVALSLSACGQQSPQSTANTDSAQTDEVLVLDANLDAQTVLALNSAERSTVYRDKEHPEVGQARVRIQVISRLAAPDPKLKVGIRAVYLCGRGCIKVGEPNSIPLGTLQGGVGAVFADAVVGTRAFDRIFVQSGKHDGDKSGDQKVRIVHKMIDLKKPIQFEVGSRNELFLSLDLAKDNDEKSKDNDTKLKAEFVATGTVPQDSSSVAVYQNDVGLSAPMEGGMKLSIPKGALEVSTVIASKDLNTGRISPSFNIWPAIQSKQPIEVGVPIDQNRLPQGLSPADYQISVNGQAVDAHVENGQLMATTTSLGSLEVFTKRTVLEPSDAPSFALPKEKALQTRANDTSACRQALVNAKASLDASFANGNFAVKTNVCENIAPFVHIVIIDRSSRYTNSMTIPLAGGSTAGSFALRTLLNQSNAVGAVTAINGFTWSGGQGDGANQVGTLDGTLTSNGVNRKTATGTERLLGFSENTGSGTAAGIYERPGSITSPGPGNNSYNIIGSTTAVYNRGACSFAAGQTDRNRWSVIGIGTNRLIFISSTSGGETEVSELCTVLEGLGYTSGAIRMDGGPSTGLTWRGALLNPITGFASLRYGSARYIAYAVGYK
jgi:hypothetical protein